jgi:signal peptidase II
MVKKEKKSLLMLFIVITAGVIFLDQLLKFLILQFKPFFQLGILIIHFISNTGAGFGIWQGKTVLLGFISLFVAGTILYKYKEIPRERSVQILFAAFLGGVIGNMLDRFFRGFVVDFIDFSVWPAFNLADAAISLSAIGLIIYFWKK